MARLQQQTWVTPLSRYPELPQTAWRTFGDRNIAPFNEGVAEELRFWEQLRAWMALFPPPDADRLLVRSFFPLGLLGGPDTYLHADADLVAILTEAAHTGQANVEALATAGAAGHGATRSTRSATRNTRAARSTGKEAASMTPQQALGMLRAHLEDIRNACGFYGVVEPYVLECGDEMLALDEAIATRGSAQDHRRRWSIMTTAEFVALIRTRERIQGYRQAAALLELAEHERRCQGLGHRGCSCLE